jgi:hypothetical protein
MPFDWADKTLKAHGVTRNARQGGYMVVLSLNHRQVPFGPYRLSITQAANAHDALCKYFLPFVKTTPRINRDIVPFLALKDEDAYQHSTEARLVKLRQRLTMEYTNQGLNIKAEQDRRYEFLMNPREVQVTKTREDINLRRSNRDLRDLQKLSIQLISANNRVREIALNCVVPAPRTRLEVSECLDALLPRLQQARLFVDGLVEILQPPAPTTEEQP